MSGTVQLTSQFAEKIKEYKIKDAIEIQQRTEEEMTKRFETSSRGLFSCSHETTVKLTSIS